MTTILRYTFSFLLILAFSAVSGQSYTSQSVSLTSMTRTATATGDYDNDGDVDLVIGGMVDSFDAATFLYENQEGEFVQTDEELVPISDGCAIFGDYDQDGDLDLFLAGNGNSDPVVSLYENQDGDFFEVDTDIAPMAGYTSASFGDYDQDGDLDLVVSGDDVTYLYRNDEGTFVDTQSDLVGLNYATTEWVDYDNDGDLDLMLAGEDGAIPETRMYKNNDGQLTEIDLALQNVMSGDVAWGDYDNDGDKDLAVVGYDEYLSGETVIYRNDGDDAFKNIGAAVLGVSKSSVEWGDADNDGDLDLLVSGSCDECSVLLTTVLRNDDGTFSDIFPGFENTERGEARFVDYDNDGDSDVLVTGQNMSGTLITKLYQNDDHDNTYHTNESPEQPAGLAIDLSGTQAMLSWNAGSDDYTPVNSLTYNLRVGTTPGGEEIMDPMCAGENDALLTPGMGNANQSLTWRLEDLQQGTYYWSVQTVDNMYHTSGFSEEQMFTVTATGIEKPGKSAFSVYPNPVNDRAEISLKSPDYHTLEIMDYSGKIYYSEKIRSQKLTVNFSGYAKGIYFLRMISDDSSHAKRIMVQ